MSAAVSGPGNGSVQPSEYLSGKTGADFLVARMWKVLGFGLGVGLSYYKQANAKLDGYRSLKIHRNGHLAPRMTLLYERTGPLE